MSRIGKQPVEVPAQIDVRIDGCQVTVKGPLGQMIHAVPDVLLSGHHAEIVRWRRQQALRRTQERRPDLLKHARLTKEDQDYLAQCEKS